MSIGGVSVVVLNLRYQRDTPTGVVDVHAFVVDNEADGYIVYTRSGHSECQKKVETFTMAIDCLKMVMDRLESEVVRC
jgi:hypothetical protein